MASAKSLGIHSPSAIPYLVSEGILPPNPASSLYRWQIYPVPGKELSEAEEELLITKHCVVWSRAGVVQRSFRFEVEKESVSHAVLTNFKSDVPPRKGDAAEANVDSSTDDPITIRKRRRQRAGVGTAISQQYPAFTHALKGSQSKNLSSESAEKSRSLVVLLKKQIHVFFLDGSSHLVHLPFPVDAVFPLPYGIVLQRQIDHNQAVKATPQMPPAPLNSFALSHLTSSGIQRSSFREEAQIARQDGTPSSVQAMLHHVLNQDQDPDDNRVSHFVLRDTVTGPEPLFALGTVDTSSNDSHLEQKPIYLEADERLVYVSSKDELERHEHDLQDSRSFLLALTISGKTGQLTVWKISSRSPKYQGRQRVTSKAGHMVESRISFTGTAGATTPTMRRSFGYLETAGVPAESTRSRKASNDEVEIASQLDPAFENPRAPTKSSRRISSLLARSELYSDAVTLGDFNSTQSQAGRSKRGPSFGGQSKRNSYRNVGRERGRGPSSSHAEFVPALSHVSDADETTYDSEMSLDEALQDTSMGSSLLQRKEHQVFTKLHSLPTNIRLQPLKTHQQVKVFTMASPAAPSTSEVRDLAICVLCASTGQSYSIDLSVPTQHAHRDGSRRVSESDIRVTGVRTAQGVQDVGLVRDGDCKRLVLLSTAANGTISLLLSSPWNTTFKLSLPQKFLVVDPFQVVHPQSLAHMRDGEFKRVLSDGPDALSTVQSCAGNGQISIVDSKNNHHCLQLQLTPMTPLVATAIRLCELLLPSVDGESQPLLRVWWEIKLLLSESFEEIESLEFRAFVASIFVFYVSFLDKPAETKPARNKRKGGLLRSSSGANMDLESFDNLMVQQCPQGGAKASWMAEQPWNWLLDQAYSNESLRSSQKRPNVPNSKETSMVKQRTLLKECLDLAQRFRESQSGVIALGTQGYLPVAQDRSNDQKYLTLRNILVVLHLLREELKLDVMAARQLHSLTPILAQLGGWLGWESWSMAPSSYYMSESEDMDRWVFEKSTLHISREVRKPADPPSIMQYVEDITNGVLGSSFPTIHELSGNRDALDTLKVTARTLMPRTSLLLELLQFQDSGPTSFIRIIGDSQLDIQMLETFPEGVAAPLHSVILSCQANPGASLPPQVLDLIDRPDLTLIENLQRPRVPSTRHELTSHEAVRDFHAVCNSTLDVNEVGAYDSTAEMDRQLVTRLIFKDDQRFAEAARILHPLRPTMAKCEQEPDWTEVDFLEAQQEVAKIVAMRTLSVSPGRAMIFFNARYPLITEKFPIHGFSLSCIIKPSNTTVTAEKSIYTEEKVSWAFFHAGVEAGLSISKDAKGIDTSWIGFNKPAELQNRHAGFMLALGLNGHLKTLAKWFAFKSFTAKHTMTSIGLLLGLAASFRGSMDTQITRLISVHVSRLLPPNSAELNLSPMVQTAGMLSLGLLYCNSQHRRMSEIMLSEIESEEQEDIVKPMENLRDEGYRTAAGFALGFINVGQGNSLKALRDMRVVERLLTLATATKRVDVVHILDKATAAAVIATALIFMKTGDLALAKKIDIPDTVHQFEYVRPDIFLLRTVARHLIMWKKITPTSTWIREQLPPFFRDHSDLESIHGLNSDQLPLFNIIAGLCLSIGLRFAGSARTDVRDLLVKYLYCFMKIVSTHGGSYDERLTRTTARNCEDIVALAAAAVMAGTGDVPLLRYLRILHGRSDSETHYGSHLAIHQAIGALFLGGGTHTFNTSNMAIASLLCAFYPLFPTSVLDNKCHLQAFRHLWVLAAEPRCLIVRAVETHRPVSLQVKIVLISGHEITKTAPCLLPELNVIARITADDSQYWPSSLDFAHNTTHLQAFSRHQSLFVRRRGAFDAGLSVFSATMRALNARHCTFNVKRDAFEWIFSLPALSALDQGERSLILPPGDGSQQLLLAGRGTTVDDRLALERGCLESTRTERLWSLRLLFAWDDKVRRVGGAEDAWLGRENIAALRAAVALHGRRQQQ